MTQAFRSFLDLAGAHRLAALVLLSAIGAITEGFGLVLLVPMVGTLTGGLALVDLPFPLPHWSLATLLALFMALVVLRSLVDMARALSAQRLEVAVVDELRRRAVAALLGAEWRTLSTMQQSANRALLVTSVDRVGEAVQHVSTLTRALVSLLALGLAALALSPALAMGCMLAGLFALAALGGLRRKARMLGDALSRRYEAIYARLEATLSALRLVKSFSRERAEAQSLADEFNSMRKAERRYLVGTSLARAALQSGAALALALAVWMSVVLWQVPAPVLLAMTAIAVRAVPLVEALQSAGQGWAHAAPAFDDAQRLIARAEAVAEVPPAGVQPRLRRALVLDRVTYRHTVERAGVSDVSFELEAGTIAALVGPSGSGKSTLADLLGGLLSPDEGQIIVDGLSLAGGHRNAWRQRVAYVQQEAMLFGGSVRQNLLWAQPDASEAQLHHALTSAAAQFVEELPGGLDCQLNEGGRSLSGGERQRIALARALLRDPDLLILDEATSAVDPESELAITSAVRRLAGSCTILVIGHRGALVDSADRRISLDSGRLVQA
ncbi:ABC transporter ATP-binding protein [Erythrobacter mangrovi]|uniref:ABC transporter ATP-binding protein n=1 Tax=Erythrobacter mangrovi TaxID=2739433 RepID=A0A7D3XZ26_9SPHN|nr:ABC transporter ATP-binding protein [Erythrobacter mangrovi]QKG70832.1 ABC transporter ATP-binding protein [Erythrobacter mangrovi]